MQSNFTTELKRELLKTKEQSLCCKRAKIAGFLRTTAFILQQKEDFSFKFITESEMLAMHFLEEIEELYFVELQIIEAKFDRRNRRERLIIQAIPKQANFILSNLGFIELKENGWQENLYISKEIFAVDCCKKAYVIGAFLGSGSCSLPTAKNNGYHLEFVFYNQKLADDFIELLASCDVLAKQIERKNSFVVYIKSRESICDLLAFLDAQNALNKIDQIAQNRDTNNQINRWTNCKLGNIDKTITAAIRQVQAIEKIEKSIGLHRLERSLLEVANARLADKNCSMQELADRLKLTKSCLNHRMRKLLQIAKEV